ncbi:FAD-dependent monooxygenase [Amycolatopsis anabasis]|uniref:FAD-dependent monooxygenase n=1 Tax=Amycolatopsis anabasis TaxID=1840409 RepID=UPI00131E8084|nr:FAD-dependent monooxygenase [Amycolatopsis anabasis]
MSETKNILISGASIAGPALAHWLRRHGFRPTVVERAPAPRPGGYAVDIRGAAITVAERMGILGDIRRTATGMRGASLISAAGKRIADLDGDAYGMHVEGDVEIMRGDLSRLLHELTADEIEYLFDDSITGMTQREHGVEVTFERNAPRAFDLVIGADGLHSNVRGRVFGEESRFVRHLGHYVAVATVPNHLGLDHWGMLYRARGKMVNLYSAGRAAEAKACFLFASPPLTYDRRDLAAQRRIVAEAFAGDGWAIPRLLEAAGTAGDFYFDTISQIHLDRWSAGRVALLGDAAYGPSLASGQGTSLALVGAYVLAGELAAARGDHQLAFARYQDVLRDFVAKNQKLGRDSVKHMAPKSAAGAWFQGQLMRMMPHLPGKDAMLRMMIKPIAEAANAVELAEYRV